MGKPVYLHAGAHRTGTSSFQLCLDLNRDALHRAGYDTAYPGRDGIPGGTLRLELPHQGDTAEVAGVLRQHSPDPGRKLILSEELIAGGMRPFYSSRFYPHAEQRLTALRAACRALGAPEITRVVLVIRSYDAFFASAYRKRAEDDLAPPFAELVPRFVAMRRGWPAIVRIFKDVLEPQELVVLDYRSRGSSTALLRRLVPELELPLEEPGSRLNLSATDAALDALQARYRAGQVLDRADRSAVIAEHRETRGPTGFASFPESERRILSERYQEHLDRIAAISGITLVR